MAAQEHRRGNMDSYPIEIDFPDISAYSAGNSGVPYLYRFNSGSPGPHVMINSLTHGNEVCGAIVVKELIDLGLHPRRGTLTLSFANVAAYQSFDPAKPDRSRFVDQDLNRVWASAVLDDLSLDSVELRRARELRPVIDTVDQLLDIHSMHERSEGLLLSGPLQKGIDFAHRVRLPGNVIVDKGHAEGCRLRDYGPFGDKKQTQNALLVECGQHWEKRAVLMARACTARFLTQSGVIDQADLPERWWQENAPQPCTIRITDAVVATSMNFRFTADFKGLECLPVAGTVVGWDGSKEIKTPYDNCVLVMPSLRQLQPGVTVVRFGEPDTQS